MISPEFKAKMITTRKLLLEGIVKKYKHSENTKNSHLQIPQTLPHFSASSPVILSHEHKHSTIEDLVDIGRQLASKIVDVSHFDIPAFEHLLERVHLFILFHLLLALGVDN